MKKLKEELTTAMHSTLQVGVKEALRQRCQSAFVIIKNIKDKKEVEKMTDSYNITVEDFTKYLKTK
jgi:hypothetical protein